MSGDWSGLSPRNCAVCGRPAVVVLANGQGMCGVHWSPVQYGLERAAYHTTAALPHLTAEELEVLHQAIVERMNVLARVRASRAEARDADLVTEADRQGLILQSLDTAVQEARGSLR